MVIRPRAALCTALLLFGCGATDEGQADGNRALQGSGAGGGQASGAECTTATDCAGSVYGTRWCLDGACQAPGTLWNSGGELPVSFDLADIEVEGYTWELDSSSDIIWQRTGRIHGLILTGLKLVEKSEYDVERDTVASFTGESFFTMEFSDKLVRCHTDLEGGCAYDEQGAKRETFDYSIVKAACTLNLTAVVLDRDGAGNVVPAYNQAGTSLDSQAFVYALSCRNDPDPAVLELAISVDGGGVRFAAFSIHSVAGSYCGLDSPICSAGVVYPSMQLENGLVPVEAEASAAYHVSLKGSAAINSWPLVDSHVAVRTP